MRILIEVARKKDITLYIGSVDISKAFDHVPRALLLKKLVKVGVGKCMLFALKQLYSLTICVLKFEGELSDSFRMERGVRQGAASSVYLFNCYMDGLFKHLEEKCALETLLVDIHTLIHTDDTILLSTDRNKFIKKCNEMMNFFNANGLSLNLEKSGYMIINPKAHDVKTCIKLQSGILKYKSVIEYLGVLVTDAASLKNDVKLYVDKKRANVSIKFTNFCKTNRNVPLHVKLDVLDTCVASALTYACETWGRYVNESELCYRSGLKTALSVRQNVNNEIVYIESGKWPLPSRVKKTQLKFWMYINEYKQSYPNSAVAKVIDIGLSNNIPYLNYYKSLQAEYVDPPSCQRAVQKQYFESFKRKMTIALENDADSKLGTYLRVNPTAYIPRPQSLMEIERELLTRYRTGSHSLAIELGRFSNTPRENRICACGVNVQTVLHIFTECQLTRSIADHQTYANLKEVFEDNNVHRKLLLICNKLKISI